jgi:hypothetical protein
MLHLRHRGHTDQKDRYICTDGYKRAPLQTSPPPHSGLAGDIRYSSFALQVFGPSTKHYFLINFKKK